MRRLPQEPINYQLVILVPIQTIASFLRSTARLLLAPATLGAIAPVAPGAEHAEVSPGVRTFLQEHCFQCHGPEKQKGSQRFDTMPTTIADEAIAQRWQDVLDVLNLDEMPPEDADQPDKDDLADVLETLTSDLAEARKRLTDAGGETVIRRLNRREYAETIRHLFGVPIETELLPEDAEIDGFDTLGQAQSFSSLHLERYLDLGRRALDRTLLTERRYDDYFKSRSEPEDAGKKLARHFEKLEKNIANFEQRVAEHPDKKEFQMRLGISKRESELLTAYLDRPETETGALIPFRGINPSCDLNLWKKKKFGTYRIRVRCGAAASQPVDDLFLKVVRGEFRSTQPDGVEFYRVTGTVGNPEVIEFDVELDDLIRSNRFSFERRNGRMETIPDLEGSRNYYFQFPQLAQLRDDQRPDLWIDWVEVEGPLDTAPPPLSAAALFPDRDPGKYKSLPDLEEASLRDLLERFTFEAFRHQEPDRAYIDRLMNIYAGGIAHGTSSAEALKDTLAIVLASPRFLFLHEPRPAGSPRRPLDGRELAVRLSYFLWSAPPDDELYQLADAGKLGEPQILKQQVDRLLDSPRSELFVDTFLHAWLELDRLDRIKPEATPSRHYDQAVQQSSRREVSAFFRTLLDENLPVHRLIDSDFITIDPTLAQFYGIPGLRGDGFRKVELPSDSVRGGLLGQSAILTLTGTGDRTSPVERGVFVLRKLLDRPPPPAPANVPMLDEETVGSRSIRDTLNVHMTKAQCHSCHRRIDPLGFGQENFDPVGQWRESVPSSDGTTRFPIEASGVMPDGQRTFDNFHEMKRELLADREAFLRGLTESLLTYALGRTVGFTDQETIEQIVAQTTAGGHGLRTLIHQITLSEGFLTK